MLTTDAVAVGQTSPLVIVRAIRRQRAPWYDEECRAAKVTRRKAEKCYRLLGSVDNLAE